MSDPPGADGKCQIRVLCMDCNESHAPGEGVHKYGKSWKCAKCHSAQRWLRENDPDWSGKSAQEKTELVLANRDHGGRGCARRLQTCHKVEVDHYENRDDEVPYLTKNRFIHKGMKWYGWTPEQAEDEWDKAVRDVNVKRRKDEYGELTIAKLKTAVHHVGVRVGNKRSIGETKKFNAEDQEAITDAKECVLRFRMDVEVGMSLPSIGDDDAGFARPKAKPKAKGGPKKASKKPKALGDGENENSEPSRKKARVDKEAKQRLDALKLQTDMVHMSQKWTSRIKTLNIEVTASIQSCQDFPHLAPLRDEVLKAFEKYAVAGPAVCASPSLTNTRLAMIQDSSVEPAPEVKVSRSAALVEPTKQGLQQYDKMMLDLESTLNRFIKQLDKETQEAQEVKEKNRILQEQLEKRLAKKKAASESAIEKGKKAGLRAAALEDSESGAGAKGTVVQAHDATTDDAGNDEGECEWKVGAELASRLEDTLPCENTVDLKHELAFIQPTVFGFPDAVDFTNYGYSIDFSCEIYKKNIPDEEEGDGANEMEGNPAYTSTTMLKDIVDPKTAINEKERIILDTVLFGPMKARECLGIDYPTSEYIKMLQGRLQYTGPEFTWCGLGKLFWGKMVCILSGERITAGIPISHFVGDIEGGANFGDINTKFTRMSRDDVVKAGGFWAYLRQGQGIVIPPAYIIMDINRGAMDYTADAEDEETAIAAVDTMVFPTLTKDQIDNFDTSVYEVAIKACSGVFEKFGNELASGKELTNIVRAAVLSRTKHEDKTPSKEHTQLVEGTTEYINGSWTNAPESLSIALEMADKLFQLICRKAVDSDMDTDGSQQAALYSRVVDLLTGPLTSKVVTMGEMYDVGKQRQPHSEEFDTLWDDLIANAHHRIHCAMDDGDDLVAKLSKLSEPEIDILCRHVSLMDVFPTFQKWIQMTHGEQDLEFGDSNADRACQLHDFTHFMDSMQGETWDAFQVLLNIKSGGLVSSAASGADKSTVVDLGKPNPSQAAEHVDTTMEKISPEASLPDTLPAQFPEKNDEAPAYEAKSPPPAKPMASSAAKSPTMLPPSVPKQSEALAKNASPVPALQPPIPKPIEAVAKSISAAAPPPKATPPGEEEPKGAKPTAMKSAQTSSKAMTSVSVEASSTEKTDKVDVAGGKATMETIGGVPVAKSPVAKPTTKAKAAAEPDNTAKPIPAAKAKTMSVPKAKAKADATPTPSVAEETTKKKRHSKQDQVDNFFNISQRKASKDKEPKTPKTSTSKASAKGKTKK